MEEEHIFSADQLASEEDTKKSSGGLNKTLLGIIVVLLLVITGGGAYFLGNQIGSDSKNAIVPTESPLKTETLGEETEEANVTPEVTVEVTPTTDPLVTPSVTPKVTAGPTIKFNPNLKIDAETFKLIPTSTPTPVPTVYINRDLLPKKEPQVLP